MALPLAMILFVPDLVLSTDKPMKRVDWLDLSCLLAPIAVGGLLTLAAVDRHSFFTWVFQSNYRATSSIPLLHNWGMITGYLRGNWALLGLSFVSTAMVSVRSKARGAVALIVAWWLITFAFLMVCSPLWRQYLVFLAYPLAVVIGGGLAATGEWMLRSRRERWRRVGPRSAWAMLTVLGLISFGLHRWEKTRPKVLDGPEWTSELLAARAFIEETVPPDGFVTTDDALLAFAAGRLVQPPFTEASKKQIELGNFTTRDAMAAMLRYGAEAAVFVTGRLIRLPGFEEWIDDVATDRREFGEMRAYRLDLPRCDPKSTIANFENGIELRGYALSRAELHPGDSLTVMLSWGQVDEISGDSHVFMHLVDDEGRLWAQRDGPLGHDEDFTRLWEEDELLFDTRQVRLGDKAPLGKYDLTVGLYHWPSLERLPAYHPDGDRWPQDRVVVTQLNVMSR
jgi:hypothetical protein